MIKLDEIQEKLIVEDDRKFDTARNWHEGYKRGVCEALKRVNNAMYAADLGNALDKPAETDVPQNKPRTNLDRIRAMSAEEIAEWAASHLECCSCPMSDDWGLACETNCAETFIKWLNSPAKEVVDG